jgi:hypothetical protein
MRLSSWSDIVAESADFERSRNTILRYLALADLKLTRPEIIETARLNFATTATERRWYEAMTPEVADVISENPELVFNADEIMAAVGVHKKVVVTCDSQLLKGRVLVEDDHKLPHYTYMACFNKFGRGPPALVIVPSITKIPAELQNMQRRGLVRIMLSMKGWMRGAIFSQWIAEIFVPWLENYRMEINRVGSRAILFLDGASSHITLQSIETLRAANTSGITFPPHCTHVNQPVDAVFARPFKGKLSTAIRTYSRPGAIEKATGETFTTQTGRLRAIITAGVVSASQSTQNWLICTHAFERAGIIPWDPEPFLSGRHPYVRVSDEDPEMRQRLEHPDRFWTGSTVLTSDAFHSEMVRREAIRQSGKALKTVALQEDGDVQFQIDEGIADDIDRMGLVGRAEGEDDE